MDKECSKCGIVKPIEDFYTKHGWPYSACKECHKSHVLNTPFYKEYQRKYHLKNRERLSSDPRQRYRTYKSNAKAREIEFDITFKEFMTLWQLPCNYCGEKIATIALDRTNNNDGYKLSNVKPCCKSCNSTKHTGTVEDLLKRRERKNVSDKSS